MNRIEYFETYNTCWVLSLVLNFATTTAWKHILRNSTFNADLRLIVNSEDYWYFITYHHVLHWRKSDPPIGSFRIGHIGSYSPK